MKSLRATVRSHAGDYDEVAAEYYDGTRHPTCQNFNALSRRYITGVLGRLGNVPRIVEVGCGESSVAPWLQSQGQPLNGLLLLDASQRMLEYSRKWEAAGATLRIGNAHASGEESASASLVVAGLGDPYNTPELWEEIGRILAPAGHVVFTTPSFDWALQYRKQEGSAPDQATFQLRDGRTVTLPSHILSLDMQVHDIHEAGLTVINFDALGIEALGNTSISPKIASVGELTPIVWGFLARKNALVPRRGIRR